MRPSKLRRWVLRGALFSAIAAAPLTASQAAQANDYNWNKAPDAVSSSESCDEATADNQATEVRTEDYNWN